jgi:hypothetical protein
MFSTKQVRDALPFTVQAYQFTAGELGLNARKPCPGKTYLDTNEIIVRVYNATISEQAGFCGEVIAIGDYVDTFSVGDYVFGGKQRPSLQAYIVVKSEDLAVLPPKMSPAAAARLYAATPIYATLQNLEIGQRVAVLGDMTGFAVQIAVQKKCIVTSSEKNDVGETAVIESDNFLEYLSQQASPFDVIVDATGDLDLYDYCEQFTTRTAEYISINPVNPLQATKAQLLPAFLGGGTRKLTVSKMPTGEKKTSLLYALAKEVQSGQLRVLDQRIVSFEAVLQVYPAIREVTVVNVVKQSDLTPPEEEEEVPSPSAKGKAKAVPAVVKPKRSPVQKRRPQVEIAEQAASPNKDYSPRRPSRLKEAMLAEQTSESSPELRESGFMSGQQHQALQDLQDDEAVEHISEKDLIDHKTPERKKGGDVWPRRATRQDEYELTEMKNQPGTLLFDSGDHHDALEAPALSLPSRDPDGEAEDEADYEDVDDADDENEEEDNEVEHEKSAALREAEEKIAALQRQIEMLSRTERTQAPNQKVTTRKLSKERRTSKENDRRPSKEHDRRTNKELDRRSSKEEAQKGLGLVVNTGSARREPHDKNKTPSPKDSRHKKTVRYSSSSDERPRPVDNPDVHANESADEEESSKLIN